MAKVAGSMWVDGSTLHYIDPAGAEWYFTGTAGSTPGGAIVGSVWVDSTDGTIHYIDATGIDRAVAVETGSSRSGVGAKKGSLWIDTVDSANNALHTIDNLQVEKIAHTDIHGDISASHTDTHGDVAASHSDSHDDAAAGHDDSHSDYTTAGGHGDVAHHDYYYDGHLDGYREDPYGNPGAPHNWIHYDWNPYTDHEDWPHADTTTPGHGDVAYVSHKDASGGHWDTAVDDDGPGSGFGHYDGGVWHGDGALGPSPFSDLTPGVSGGYTDSHTDYTVSGSGTHGDSHGDGSSPHGDSHGDTTTGHTDTHADVTIPHTDTHADQPVSLGP